MSATAEIIALPLVMKRCPACKETKVQAEYYADRHRKNGCSTYCKKCFIRLATHRWKESRDKANRKHRKKKWANHSSRERTQKIVERFERHVKTRYGVSMDSMRTALASQHGLCANRACGLEISLDVHGREPNRAVIDHCHATDKFRGLLCHKCNHAEGFYSANKNRLIGIVEYLDRSSVK